MKKNFIVEQNPKRILCLSMLKALSLSAILAEGDLINNTKNKIKRKRIKI